MSKEEPVYIKDISDKEPLSILDIAMRTVSVVYALLVTWQTAKVLVPQLSVHEQIAVAWAKQKIDNARGKEKEVPVPRDWMSDLMDDLRSP